jgi:hypothetical protein
MARGIWENSLLKIFLTRSFLGPLFRPFLYSAEEYVHYTFLEDITILTQEIIQIRNLKKRGLTYYWLIEVPRSLFEELFINSVENQGKCQIFKDIKAKEGTEMAYLTQGFILAIMPYMLQKDESLDLSISPSISELEQIIIAAYGSKNRIFYYQYYFQQLLADFFPEKVDDAIARLYIEKVIEHLTGLAIVPGDADRRIKIQQETLNYCLWKLQNTKSSVTAMVNYLGEIKNDQASHISNKETNY